MRKSTRVTGLFLIILAAGLWASSGIFVTGVIRNSNISPLNLAFLREFLTFLVLFGFLRILKPDTLQVKKSEWGWLALMGGIGIGLFQAIWIYSVIINGMSVATMLQYNEAVIISIAAVLFFKERMHWRKVTAIVGSLIGTTLISGIMRLDAAQIARVGLLIGISSAIAHSAFHLFGKKLTGSYPSSTIMLYAFGFATLTLLPFQLLDPVPTYVSMKAIGHLVILVLGPTLIGFAAYTAALRWLPVSTAIVIATCEVPMAALFGIIFLGESLGIWQAIGAGLVVLGVILVSVGGKQQPFEVPDQSIRSRSIGPQD
jgi:drug/metabolite transporter (DMT)-like permease